MTRGDPRVPLTRRGWLIGATAALADSLGAKAAVPSSGLLFKVFRNDRPIGEQQITFSRNDGEVLAQIAADLAVKIGPVTVYRYHFEALERWRGRAFATLDTATNDNGRKLRVTARNTVGRVRVESASGFHDLPDTAIPLTHWNRRIASSPLFNPQDGKRLAETVSLEQGRKVELSDGSMVEANAILLRGDADIDDLYDQTGDWVGLVGRLKDGSRLVYKRR